MNDLLVAFELQWLRVAKLPVTFQALPERPQPFRWSDDARTGRQSVGRPPVASPELSKAQRQRIYNQRHYEKEKAARAQLRHEAQLAHAREGLNHVV
jgi:hypothetical protein